VNIENFVAALGFVMAAAGFLGSGIALAIGRHVNDMVVYQWIGVVLLIIGIACGSKQVPWR